MINFNISLSIQSCQLLFNLIEWVKIRDVGITIPKGRDRWTVEHELFCKTAMSEDLSHFIVHARMLKKEKLIISKKEEPLNKCIITEKGYLMAKVLKIEFEDAKEMSRKLTASMAKQLAKQK